MRDDSQNVVEAIERHVTVRAGEPAVTYGEETLTYEGLNQLANRVAHAILARRGDQAEPVAILMNQGAGIIAAILGVLKAGKFYLPLDARHPPARNAAILHAAGAALLIADQEHISQAGTLARDVRQCLNVDDLYPALPTTNPLVRLGPDAYVNLVFTSGSTGRPKGAVQTHGNVLHDVRPRVDFQIKPQDRVGLLVPCPFDASVSNIFGALVHGASLYPFDLQGEGVAALASWLKREAITIYHSVPTVYRLMLRDVAQDEQFPAMRLIKLGGETVLWHDVELFRRHFTADCRLRVALGTTETYTITYMLIDHTTPIEDGPVPVGYPDVDKEVLLLDDERRPVADGEIGEIAVRSRYISPGYWADPGLTADRFLPDPDGSVRCIYLTGDLGKWLADGTLGYLGRKDFQVKIRGQRIEPAEIEAALREVAGIAEAVVVAREKEPGDTRLVAYVVPADGAGPPAFTEVREALRGTLPEHMIPYYFMVLNTLPLLPIGKVDRQALPSPDWQQLARSTDAVAPQSALQAVLAEMWAEVLAMAQVGVDDDFFALGGHSLAAAELAARIRARWAVPLTLAQFMQMPTVSEQARWLNDVLRADWQSDDERARLRRALQLLGYKA